MEGRIYKIKKQKTKNKNREKISCFYEILILKKKREICKKEFLNETEWNVYALEKLIKKNKSFGNKHLLFLYWTTWKY